VNENPPSQVVDLEVRCPLETGVLSLIRTFISSLAREMGFSDGQTGEIEMAVDEACANVIRHAYKHLGVSPDLPGHEAAPPASTKDCLLMLRVSLANDSLRIQVIDNGIGMKNRPGGVKSVEEFTEKGGGGGLGTYIIRNFMDEVDYDYPEERGTVLTMTKYLRPSN
jgi:serine/threonine-protein kinase RsbW